MAKQKTGKRKKHGSSRAGYWLYRRLEKHKVKHLVQSNGMKSEQALHFWRSQRKGRVTFDLYKNIEVGVKQHV